MGTKVRCHVCGEKLYYSYSDPSPLINHLRINHNNEDVMYFEGNNQYGPYGDVKSEKKFKTTGFVIIFFLKKM